MYPLFNRLSIILLSFLAGIVTCYFFLQIEKGLNHSDFSKTKSKQQKNLTQQDNSKASFEFSGSNLPEDHSEVRSGDLMRAFQLGGAGFLVQLVKASGAELMKAIEDAKASGFDGQKNNFLAILVSRLGEIDGSSAVGFGLQELEQNGNALILREAFRGLAKRNPAEALRQLDTLLLNNSVHEDIQQSIVADWASRSPEAAAAFALNTRNSDNPQGLVAVVADEWSRQNPAAAANWAGKLTPGIDKIWAINNIIANWAGNSLDEVASYVAAQSAGENRDLMAASLAQKIAKADLDSGFKWIEMIQNDDIQRVATMGFLLQAYQKNPTLTISSIQKSRLPNGIKEDLLSRLTKD
jgi:hypothetical protein